MRRSILFFAAALLVSACDTAVSPLIAGAGNGGVVGDGAGGSGGGTTVQILPSQVEISPGTTFRFTINVDATLLRWRSDAGGVASVSAQGVVTGISQGTAKITALLASDTTRRSTATVTVRP
jgi:uncharacterized protein YjdB